MAFERMFQDMDPFGELTQIQRRLTDMLQQQGLPRLRGWIEQAQAPEYPPVNLYVTPSDVVVAAELPGINPQDVDITVVSGVLTLKGARVPDTEEGAAYYRRERAAGEFSRSVPLPEEVDSDKAGANYNKGILTIVLPRAEEAKPRKIKINAD